MRKYISSQLYLGEVGVVIIQINLRSIDDIHKMLMRLHLLYVLRLIKYEKSNKLCIIVYKVTNVVTIQRISI